jgi:NAD(P)H-dependent flavin oxidoreductase YrpB (nitropropane dioxygenase family)
VDQSGTLGDSDGTSIKAQIFDAAGAKVGSEFLVNTEAASYQFKPVIARLADGGFVVSWEDNGSMLGDSDYGNIKAQVFGATGAKIGSEFLVNTETVSSQLFSNFRFYYPLFSRK